jgi:serine/threonine protein phosphatase PrpC
VQRRADGHAPEGEIAAILEGAESPGAASEELAAAAVRAGGGDNVTALCAFVQ